MKTIEVKSCGECPFKGLNISHDEVCMLDDDISAKYYLPKNKVHENCPLKKEQVTVKLKEE